MASFLVGKDKTNGSFCSPLESNDHTHAHTLEHLQVVESMLIIYWKINIGILCGNQLFDDTSCPKFDKVHAMAWSFQLSLPSRQGELISPVIDMRW